MVQALTESALQLYDFDWWLVILAEQVGLLGVGGEVLDDDAGADGHGVQLRGEFLDGVLVVGALVLFGADVDRRVALVQLAREGRLAGGRLPDHERDRGADCLLDLEEDLGLAAVGVDVALAALHLLLVADGLFVFGVQLQPAFELLLGELHGLADVVLELGQVADVVVVLTEVQEQVAPAHGAELLGLLQRRREALDDLLVRLVFLDGMH